MIRIYPTLKVQNLIKHLECITFNNINDVAIYKDKNTSFITICITVTKQLNNLHLETIKMLKDFFDGFFVNENIYPNDVVITFKFNENYF